jgi:hypothetical protein
MCALSIGFPLPVKQEVQHAADVIPRTRGAPTTLPSRGGQIDRPAPLQRCDQGLREVVREILLLSTLCPVPPGVRCVARLLESSRPTSPEPGWGRGAVCTAYGLALACATVTTQCVYLFEVREWVCYESPVENGGPPLHRPPATAPEARPRATWGDVSLCQVSRYRDRAFLASRVARGGGGGGGGVN